MSEQSGCWLCKNEGKRLESYEQGDIAIVEPPKYTLYGDGYEYIAPLRFCPVCGRSLEARIAKEVAPG